MLKFYVVKIIVD